MVVPRSAAWAGGFWDNGPVSLPESLDPSYSDEPLELISKPRKLILWSIVAAVMIVISFVVMGVLLKRSEAGTVFTLSDQIGIGGVGVILAGGALMFTRPRVWANRERIRVRNVFTTKTLPWGVVRDIGVSQGSAWALLDLQDDDQLSLLGLQVADGQRSVDAIRRLRQLHAAAVTPPQDAA